jgi:glucosamine--fructose-6-phosphate aminotransferase (isomerizing)
MSAPAGEIMAAEIAEQPQALARLLAASSEIADTRRAVLGSPPRCVLFAARGTSDHVALYAKYLTEIRLGLPAGLVSPSSFTLYQARPDLSGVLFVGISQSGGSPDLVESMQAAAAGGARTLVITNNVHSPLAATADHVVDILAGPELAVAATKSYTSQLLAAYLLLVGDVAAAAAVPDVVGGNLADAERAYAAATRYRFAERLLTVGRGYSYPSARESALKIMETSYTAAQAFSGADLMHGPLAMVGPGTPVIAVGAGARPQAALSPVLDRLTAAGADVLKVGPADGLPVVTGGLSEELLPVVEIVAVQLLAWQLALDRGGNPDRPRGLSKVTETR